jgi:beta-glucanase (GH16 family)
VVYVSNLVTFTMSLKQSLGKLLDKGKAELKGSSDSHNGVNGQGAAPPVPTSSKPKGSTSSHAYWQASFDPSVPVSHNFKHECGQHGWGNNEAQNYTSSTHNSYHTKDHKLVLRAVAQSSTATHEERFTSARLVSQQKLGRQRGCLIATLTPACASGIWPAFWLLPSQPFTWPTDGEFDIMETWNGDGVNHSCLHWGHFNGEDWNKHRVLESNMPDIGRAQGHTYGFAWNQPEDGKGGKAVWYIDGKAIMKAEIPPGTRKMEDWNVIINVAMGGNVCQGRMPADGEYHLVVHDLKMTAEPAGGWHTFEKDFSAAPEGHPM